MGRFGDSLKRLSKTIGITKADPVDDVEEEHVSSSSSELSGSDTMDINLDRLRESESESDFTESESEEEEEEEKEEIEEEEEDIPLSEAELDDDADVIPYQKTTINNHKALKASIKSIQLPASAMSNLQEHMSLTSKKPIVLKDIYDDTERELAFYKQALDAATQARSELKKLKVEFARPVDYFAEMVKSDEHMDKIKRKMIDEETAKRASQEAKKQRELKKFGKKVQNAKLQERQKEKRETMEKIKSLKRKRNNDEISGDQFDIEVEDVLKDKKKERNEKYKLGGSTGSTNSRREAKNKKYGSGGRKHGMNRNSAESSADLTGFKNSKKKQRPGKSRRH